MTAEEKWDRIFGTPEGQQLLKKHAEEIKTRLLNIVKSFDLDEETIKKCEQQLEDDTNILKLQLASNVEAMELMEEQHPDLFDKFRDQ